MAPPIPRSDVRKLVREADVVARRLIRRLGLPLHHIEDARQDLLLDLIRRMPAYDSRRGSFGAFAGTVMAHRAARMKAVVRRERALFGIAPVSLDEPLPGAEGLTRGDVIPEEEGYGSSLGQPTNRFEELDRRLDLATGLTNLTAADARLCALLASATIDELVARGTGARTSLYRKIGRIRLELTAAGVAGE